MPVSVYRTVFHEADCQKLAPSSKEINMYTTDKIPVIGSCRLLVVHLDTQSSEEVTFQVTSQEGSVVLSCVTTLELGLIQPCSDLEVSISASASLISSTADYSRKNRSKESKPKKNVSSNKQQSPELLPAQGQLVVQCIVQEILDKTSQQEYTAQDKYMEDDKNCQVDMWSVIPTVCGDDKKCQSTQCMWQKKPTNHMQSELQSSKKQYIYEECSVRTVYDDNKCQSIKLYKKLMCSDKNCQDTTFMQVVKPEMDMQSKEPQSSFKKKHVPLCSDKNCQYTRCYNKKNPVKQGTTFSDKNCQEIPIVHVQPKKPSKESSYMQLPKPARKQVIHKNCQSTRCFSFKKKCPVRPVCDDKNCESANLT